MKKGFIWATAIIAALALIAGGLYLYDGRGGTIVTLGNQEMIVEYGGTWTDPGAQAYTVGKLFPSKPLDYTVQGQVDSLTPGEYEIRYTAQYRGKTYEAARKVTVIDSVPPEITLLNEEGEQDFSAWDNCDGDITGSVKRTETEDQIIYTVSDSAGNETTAERRLDPVITLNEDDMEFTAGTVYEDPGFTAVDCYGADLTDRVEVEGSIRIYKAGEYAFDYTVTDDRGRSSTVTRNISILPVERPETVQPEPKTIYLTFDDGPNDNTRALLEVLAKYDAKVTFFVTAASQRNLDIIAEEYEQGHSIGIHAYRHNAQYIYTSEEDYFNDLNAMNEIIYEQTGEYSRIVRFPGGSSNTVSRFNPGIMTKLAEDLEDMGYRYYDWNLQPEKSKTTEGVASTIIATAKAMSDDTVLIPLQHDTRGYSVMAVEEILKWGTENGYTFKGIDLTTPEVHHKIAN